MKKTVSILTLAVFAVITLSGCQSQPAMPLETGFRQIQPGLSNSSEVMQILPQKNLLHTENRVSVYQKDDWNHEAGIVTFAQDDSSVLRKVYLQRQDSFMEINVYLFIQTVVPEEILLKPYENNMRKQEALLRFCHEAMIDDVRPFNEDPEIVSQMGLARTGLGIGILKLTEHPRQAFKLDQDPGFDYDHPTLGKCQLTLTPQEQNIYTLELRTKTLNDPLTKW